MQSTLSFVKMFLVAIFAFSFLVVPLAAPGTFFAAPHALAQPSPSPGGGDPDCGDFEKSGPLCLPTNPFPDAGGLVSETTATGLIANVIGILLYFGGIVAVLFIIIGGYYYLTARGNEEQATKGRHTLVYALIGLSLIILSYVIVNVLTNQLTNGS